MAKSKQDEPKLTQPDTAEPNLTSNLDSLNDALAQVRFPARKPELMRHIGPLEIQWSQTESMVLADILHDSPQEEFQSQEELIESILSVIRLSFGDHGVPDGTQII